MDDISAKTPEELATLVRDTEDKDILRAVATKVGVTFSGNTGPSTLKEKILTELILDEEPDEDDEPDLQMDENDAIVMALRAKQEAEAKEERKPKAPLSIGEMSKTLQAELDPRTPGLTKAEVRAIVRAKAMKLTRVRVSNLDPADAAVPGAIISVVNQYLGKVSKYVPFGEENEGGYHLPEVLIKELRGRTYNMRKEIKKAGSSFGVKQYKTVPMRKFAIEILPPLTKDELQNLAKDQKARNAIDHE